MSTQWQFASWGQRSASVECVWRALATGNGRSSQCLKSQQFRRLLTGSPFLSERGLSAGRPHERQIRPKQECDLFGPFAVESGLRIIGLFRAATRSIDRSCSRPSFAQSSPNVGASSQKWPAKRVAARREIEPVDSSGSRALRLATSFRFELASARPLFKSNECQSNERATRPASSPKTRRDAHLS